MQPTNNQNKNTKINPIHLGVAEPLRAAKNIILRTCCLERLEDAVAAREVQLDNLVKPGGDELIARRGNVAGTWGEDF